MKKPKEYSYLLVLQGYYCGSWEDLTAEDKSISGYSLRMKQTRKDYQENERGSYRIINRRELNV